MARTLPDLRVLENNLSPPHPGSALRPGSVLKAPDTEVAPETELADLYAPSADRGVSVRANFISTLDGSVIGSDGRSGSINGPADLRVFQLLRAQADAVFVGAGTARIEGYSDTELPVGLAKLRPAGGVPQMVTATRSGELHPDFLQTDPIVITAENQPAAAKLRDVIPSQNLLICGSDETDFGTALEILAERGFHNILCEGGPHLMGSLISAGLITELCLSFSPTVVGGTGPRIVAGALAPTDAQLQVLLSSEDGFLLSRWLLRPEI